MAPIRIGFTLFVGELVVVYYTGGRRMTSRSPGNPGNSATRGFQTLRDSILVKQPPVLGNHGVIGMTVEGIRAGDEVRIQRVRPPGDGDFKAQWPATNGVGAPAAQAAPGRRENMTTMI
jgi:hypothetical protein